MASSYVVAIPTYNRIDEVIKKTLNTLKEGCVNKNKIYLFVANKAQYELYEKSVPKNLYNKIHNDYKNSGSIQQKLWLNLYQSFVSMMIDYGNDNLHPGPLSHQHYGKFLASTFKKLSV